MRRRGDEGGAQCRGGDVASVEDGGEDKEANKVRDLFLVNKAFESLPYSTPKKLTSMMIGDSKLLQGSVGVDGETE